MAKSAAADGYAPLATPLGASADRQTHEHSSPLDRAHWLSRLTLAWVTPLVRRGYQKPLDADDVWDLPTPSRAATLQNHFHLHTPITPASLRRALWHSTKATMALAIVLHVVSATATVFQPLLIHAMIQSFQGQERTSLGTSNGYVLAALLTLASIVGVTAIDYGMFLTMHAGVNARTIVVNSVYQKLLKLTAAARASRTSGDLITLASVDSERVYEAYAAGLWALVSPLLIASVCVLIGVHMGALVGLAAAVSSIAILGFAMDNSRRIGRTRRDILAVTSERVRTTNEVLQGIRAIKLAAWEAPIAARVAAIRDREIRLLRSYDYLRASNLVMLMLAQTLVAAVCLIVYIYQGNELTVSTAFTLLALTNACRVPFGKFLNGVVFTSEAIVSTQRLAAFLAAEEITPAAQIEPLIDGEPIIEIQDADFSWVPQSSSDAEAVPTRPTLRNINFSVMPGSLTIIVGAVGSGKSSLVSALLGEMEHLRGARAVRGAIAYASQQAWIQHNTVRDNIVFGAPFDAAYYDKVISACQLTRDLEILDDGDMTEIGERGINLSGGQKARVSLARAMYRRDADLVVLDDPLSALDVHVANAVFFECVKGLVATKTRLLVLNAHYHLLRHADRIVVLSDGEIVGDGSYEEVQAKFTFLEDHAREKAIATANDKPDLSLQREDSVETPVEVEQKRLSIEASESKIKSLMSDEDRAIGAVTWRTYITFLTSSGFPGAVVLLVIVVLFALGQVGMVSTDYFVSYWSNGSISQLHQHSLLWIYVGIVAAAIGLGVVRAVVFTEVCVRASRTLHAAFFSKVLRAPIHSFFDITPVGRILNRFSRDLDQIDGPLPFYALGLLIFATHCVSIFVVCAVTTPTTLILYAPLLIACYFVQQYFLSTSRELKRFDGITRSPFVNLVAETINGIESIRSFGTTKSFSTKCHELLDANSKFFFLFQTTTLWFSMRLDWLVTTVVAVVSFTCVASRHSVGAASAGLALTYAVQLSMQFQRTITLWSTTENVMTSYERLAHYGTLDQEGDTKEITNTLPPSWPQKGTIEFKDVYLRYRDGLDCVLRGVSFTVQDGEKIGVCGRTGSGKSTLMNALFRTVEIAQGVIRIDGVDITSVTLHELRSHLTIIPQDPVLFSGTLRENLDPFSEKSDDELFSALRQVHLMEDVGRWGHGLSYVVSEKGENLSVGQRQLICIARALLRESRVVVLDEATASVDQELDRLIQAAVKECFRGRTALTIAHRLETIADSDRIVVMEQGRVAEFDTPAALLATPNGLFASLIKSVERVVPSPK